MDRRTMVGLKNEIKGGVRVRMTAIAEKFNFDLFPLCYLNYFYNKYVTFVI